MRRSTPLFWPLALLAIFIITLTPAAAQVPAHKCNSYSLDPAPPFCLLVPVEDASGAPLPGAQVTVVYEGLSVNARTSQSVDGPAGEAIAALPLEQIGVRPGDHLEVTVRAGAAELRQVVGFRPDPQTRSFMTDPVRLAEFNPPAPISGLVYTLDLDQATAVSGYTLELYRDLPDGELLDRFVSGERLDFSLNPGELPQGTRLWVVATRDQMRSLITFTWQRRPLPVQIVLNWPCGGITPNTSGGKQLPNTSGGKQLPDPFCVIGTATLNGQALAGVEVSAQLVAPPGLPEGFDPSPVITQTRRLPQLQLSEPIYLMDIGRLTSLDIAASTVIRFTARRNALIGSLDLSLADLRVREQWGARVLAIELRQEHMPAAGMPGGRPSLVAVTGSGPERMLYAVARDGLLLRRHPSTPGWLALLGNTATMRAQPELATLAAARLASGADLLVAGTLSGELYRSLDSGDSWMPQPSPVGRVRALSFDAQGALYVLGSSGLAQMSLNPQVPLPTTPLPAPPTDSHSLAAAGGNLFAGGPTGLAVLPANATAWQPLRNEPVNALAAGPAEAILVGTNGGLFETNAAGTAWVAQDLPEAVTALASSDQTTLAITAAGLSMRDAPDRPWELLAISDATVVGVGLDSPSVYAIHTLGERSYAATQTGVMISDDNGQNWETFNPAFSRDTRALAFQADGALLALSPSGLFVVTPSTIQALELPVSTNLNPAALRVSNDGAVTLVGRAGGPGNQLLIRDGAWSSLALGSNRGVSAISFLPGARGNSEAVLGTVGDGLWLWQRGVGLSPFPALPTPEGRRLAIGALWITPDICTIVVGTNSVGASTPAAIYTRPCDTTSPWAGPQNLTRSNNQPTRRVTALIGSPLDPSRLFAATEAGFFQGQRGGAWTSLLGLPMRPLTLAPAANYATERTLLTGGIQSGAVRLFDATPDLDLRLQCPAEALGDTQITCTLTALNQGLLAAAAGPLSLDWPEALSLVSINAAPFDAATPAPTSLARPALSAGAQQTYALTFQVAREVRPSKIWIEAAANPVPEEVFTINNQHRTPITLGYRDAPDPALVFGGQRMTPLGATGTLQIVLTNPGTQALTSNLGLYVELPPNLELEAAAGATQLTARTLRWDLTALAAEEARAVRLTYRMPATLTPALPLEVSARLDYAGDDRELANNQDTVTLLPTPSEPEVVVLTHMPRLAQRGPVTEARSALTAYLTLNGGLEIALDEAPACAAAPQGLSCAYEDWDAAVAALDAALHAALPQAELDPLALAAVDQRILLQQAIEAYIAPQLAVLNPPPSYLYLIGDDEVIPYAAVADELDSDDFSYQESYYALTIAWDDSLFSLFKANFYPSDRPYDQIALPGASKPMALSTSRQPGNPQEIAAALRLFHLQGGTLVISAGTVSGAAKELTEDGQQAVCELMRQRGLPLSLQPGVALDCNAIPQSVAAGLPALNSGRHVVQLSDHASRVRIGDISTLEISKLTPGPEALNLIFLLGCHGGVSAGIAAEPTLVTELARLGQPSFGYLGYAYAGTIQEEGALAYAERLQFELANHLLGAEELTLAEGMRRALADYAGSSSLTHSNRHTKTLQGLALFGPPDYRLKLAGQNAGEPLIANAMKFMLSNLTAPAALPAPGSTLTLSLQHNPLSIAEGTYFRVQPSSGQALLLTDAGLPLQPAVDLALDPTVGGVLIRDGSFTEIEGFDPVIIGAAPVSAAQRYSERAYSGGRFDRPGWLNTYAGGNGNSHLLLASGQWSPEGACERLIDSLSLELLERRSGGQPAQLGGPASNCRLNERIRVNVPNGTGISRIEVVLIEDGRFSVHPMRPVGHRWTATFAAKPWSRYMIQAVGSDGSVTLDTNHGAFYIVPDEHAPCGTGCDINSALDDLEVTFLADGRAQFRNYSLTCRYEVGLAAYAVHGPELANQTLYDSAKKLLQPEATTTLEVGLPACAAQVDAFYGSTLADPAPPRYADRLLASGQVRPGQYCSP